MEATGDRSAIVSASLPQLVQCSGQGFNQLHLPPPALHSVSLFNSPSESFLQSCMCTSVCCMFMPFCSHFPFFFPLPHPSSSLYPFPLVSLRIHPVLLLPLFLLLHWLWWLHHWLLWPSDSPNLTFRHRVHLLFVSVNTAWGIWSMYRLSIGNTGRPVHLADALWKTSIV